MYVLSSTEKFNKDIIILFISGMKAEIRDAEIMYDYKSECKQKIIIKENLEKLYF